MSALVMAVAVRFGQARTSREVILAQAAAPNTAT
jgi:hypothetical protein